MNPFLERVDNRLHEIGQKRPWLAKVSGVKVRTINSWFLNDRYPSVRDAALIGTALEMSLDYLVTGEEVSRRSEDPVIADIIAYLEGLRPTERQQAYGIIKLARLIRLSDDPFPEKVRQPSQTRNDIHDQ